METDNKPALIKAKEEVIAEIAANQSTLVTLAQLSMPDGTTEDQAKRRVLKEVLNFEEVLMYKPELAALDKGSIMLAIRKAITKNVTLSKDDGLVYLYPGKVCIGINPKTNAKEWKEILICDLSAEGEISVARQAKTLIDHKRPICAFHESTGKVISVTFEFLVPAHPKPRWESVTFDINDFERWRIKSEAKFGKANANYTNYKGGIDPEFARAKAIKHGLKKRGKNANEVMSGTESVEESVNTENVSHVEVAVDPDKVIKSNPVMVKEGLNKTVDDVQFEEVKPSIEENSKVQFNINNEDLF